MRIRIVLTCAALAGASVAGAQDVTVKPQPVTAMPGVAVGSSFPAGSGVVPVGTQLPKAAPSVGTPVGNGTGRLPNVGTGLDSGVPQSPDARFSFKPLDLKNVIAPYPNMPEEKTYWQKLEDRYMNFLLPAAPTPRAPNYTPGIARRNRERAKERARSWDRD